MPYVFLQGPRVPTNDPSWTSPRLIHLRDQFRGHQIYHQVLTTLTSTSFSSRSFFSHSVVLISSDADMISWRSFTVSDWSKRKFFPAIAAFLLAHSFLLFACRFQLVTLFVAVTCCVTYFRCVRTCWIWRCTFRSIPVSSLSCVRRSDGFGWELTSSSNRWTPLRRDSSHHQVSATIDSQTL